MFSEGRVDADNVFSLKDGRISLSPFLAPRVIIFANPAISGTLTMYLDKETYERAGLVGKPYGVKGQRDLKPRWGKNPY